MNDSNATERLREMLDERGVELSGEVLADCLIVTTWSDNETVYEFNELTDSNHAYLEMNINPCTPDQAIAATLGGGTLTANDVLNAVYKHGARWQAIADELNSRAERTCHIEGSYYDELFDETCTNLSCGHAIWQNESPNYCPHCGAKVVGK